VGESVQKAVLIVLLLAVVAVAAWWVVFQPRQPAQPPIVPPAYSYISETWKSKGLETEIFHANLEILLVMPLLDLEEMKGKFVQLKNSSSEASEQAMLTAYADLTSLAVEMQQLRELEYKLETMEGDACSNALLLQQYLEQLKKTETAFEQSANSSNSFAQNYREQAEAIQFFESGYSYLQQTESLKQHYMELESVVRLCA
jgi:hypothetical protein